jgi:hypothetical protein
MIRYAADNQAGQATITPSDSAIYDMAREGKSAQEILAFIGASARRPFDRYLAKALMNLGVSSKINSGRSRRVAIQLDEAERKVCRCLQPKHRHSSAIHAARAQRGTCYMKWSMPQHSKPLRRGAGRLSKCADCSST